MANSGTNVFIIMRGSIPTFSSYFAALNNVEHQAFLGRSDGGVQGPAWVLFMRTPELE